MKMFDVNKPRVGCRKTAYTARKKVAVLNDKNEIIKIYNSCKEAALGLNTSAGQISKTCLDNEYADIPYHTIRGNIVLHYASRHLKGNDNDKIYKQI